MEPEKRQCNECGEIWTDTGNFECPFCGSEDTQPVEDDELYEYDEDDYPEPSEDEEDDLSEDEQ